MSLAKKAIKVLEQVQGSSIGSVGDLKSGDWVIYKDGHPLAGTTGIVIETHPDASTIDMKVGKATKMGVPASDLMSIPTPGGGDTKVGTDVPSPQKDVKPGSPESEYPQA